MPEEQASNSRDLYIDLLIRVVANTIYRDPSIGPSNAGPYRDKLREFGLDWPVSAHTMIGLKRLRNLRELAEKAIAEKVPGDFIETGVWRGGACILLRGILAAHGITDRIVYVADSFAGLPPPNPQAFPDDEGWSLNDFSELSVSLAQVKENFERYGLLDDQVQFVKGWFSETLPSLDAGPFALLRLDGDLYESTINALDALYPKLSPGGFVIVDDYRLLQPCREATDRYRDRWGITSPINEIDGIGVWWQK